MVLLIVDGASSGSSFQRFALEPRLNWLEERFRFEITSIPMMYFK